MARGKLIKNFINSLNEIQEENKQNPNEETVHGSIFDLLKNKAKELKNNKNNKNTGKTKDGEPKGFFDIIQDNIKQIKEQNKKDPNVKTVPESIFDKITDKVKNNSEGQDLKGIRRIVDEYNLKVKHLPSNALHEIHMKYVADRKKLNKRYAQIISKQIKMHKK